MMSAERRVMNFNSALITLHSALRLNADRLRAMAAPVEQPDKDRARDIDGRKQVDDETEHERDGETAYRPRPEDEQKERRDKGRHLRVNDRHKRAPKALIHSREDGIARVQLLADPLTDKH